MKVGLGTDIAGGYQTDIMASMRMAVVISKIRQGAESEEHAHGSLEINWIESLYLATKGGAIALGLEVGDSPYQEGLPFDAQQSKSSGPQLEESITIAEIDLCLIE